MGSISRAGGAKPGFPLLLMMIALAAPLPAQSAGSLSLATEIANIEQAVRQTGTGAAEKRAALTRLARLYQLAGNLEAAAGAWTRAALAEPGKQDGAALLEGALVYLALGEHETARANLNTALSLGSGGEVFRRARYIAAQLEAFSRGDPRALAALLEDGNYREYRPAMLYTLWRVSGDTAYRVKLLAEYPASPEGRIAAAETAPAGTSASLAPLALWFLFPGRESVVLGPAVPVAAVPVTTVAAGTGGAAVPGSPSLLPPVTTDLSALTGEKPAASLQAGLFSREENAQALVRRLAAAGFSAVTGRRRLSGADYWAVTVPAGTDTQQTIMRLKDAGFESFPVY